MTTEHRTEFERRVVRAFTKDFVPAVIGYCVVTLAIILLVDFEGDGALKYLAALLPLIPALWGVRAVARQVQRVDEMARYDLLVAMSFGFGIAMIAAITMAFLNLAGLESRYWGAWAIYGAGMAGWSVAGITLQTRNG